jgi:5-methylcytosine-specific restriction endonuclease McrA
VTEKDARGHCATRDRRRCRVPGCAAYAHDLHHIIYRSHATPEQMWDTSNLISLCRAHHALVHAGTLEIAGNADHIVEITGDDFDLQMLQCHETGL